MNVPNILLGVAVVAGLVGGYLWLFPVSKDAFLSLDLNQSSTTNQSGTTSLAAVHDAQVIVREPSSPDRAVYINQEWRLSFEYPIGWKIREPAFGSATTLTNLAIWPEEENVFDPVSINITPKWWMDRLTDKKEGDIMIGGKSGWYYQSVTMSVIPNMIYTVLINDEYWVTIGIQNEYLDDFQMVLDTFQFHEPLPTLDDLGIDPPMPGQTRQIQ